MRKRFLIFGLALSVVAPHLVQAQVDTTNYSQALSAILSAGTAAAKIRSLRKVPSVGVIRVDKRFVSAFSDAYENAATLQILAERNHAGISKLRSALANNPVTRRVLEQHGVSPSRVIGTSVGSNGSLRLFVI